MCADGCSTCKCDDFGAVTASGCDKGPAPAPAPHRGEGGSEGFIVQFSMFAMFALLAAFVLVLCHMCCFNTKQEILIATAEDEEEMVERPPTPRQKPIKSGRSPKTKGAAAATAGWGGGKSSGGKKSSSRGRK